jgi:hypothetical protein
MLLPDGGRVRVTADRIKPLARTLIELFDGKMGGEIRLSRYDVARIDALVGMERWQFKGMEAVRDLANKLRNTSGIKAVNPPEGFALQLRPYQIEGLSWLQYLREQELSGILADDMGLGKTAQALAHLLLEKKNGRMDKPSLVVLPTSLIFNWKREAERLPRNSSCFPCKARQERNISPRYAITMSFLPPTRCCGATKRHWRSMSTTC